MKFFVWHTLWKVPSVCDESRCRKSFFCSNANIRHCAKLRSSDPVVIKVIQFMVVEIDLTIKFFVNFSNTKLADLAIILSFFSLC